MDKEKQVIPAHSASDISNVSDTSRAPRQAKLPAHSRAMAAQRLNDAPLKTTRGVYYPAPHRKFQPDGWRTRRYIKRKHLRRSNQQYAEVDRIGTHVTMLPMALIALVIMVVLAGLLVTLTAVVEAIQLRYQQDVVTLADILPGDSLKMYASPSN